MKKGFKITFDTNNKTRPWLIKPFGQNQEFSFFEFGDRKDSRKPIIKCANCGVTHWRDLEYEDDKDT